MSGVVGRHKFTYDVWGDAVNVAARLESAGEPGRINVSGDVHALVNPYFELSSRGSISVKNKDPLPMYFLERLKAEFSADEAGRVANESFFARIQAPLLPTSAGARS